MEEGLFASDREKRLWTWSLIVTFGIYLTLGLSGSVATFFSSDLVQVTGFLLGTTLVGTAVVTMGLRVRFRATEIAIVVGVLAVYLMVFQRMGAVVERSHLMEYSVLAVFVYAALAERAANGRQVPVPGVLAFVITSGVGMIDELIQLPLPNRVFDPIDIVFNCLAAFMAVTGVAALSWARRRRGSAAE